MYKLTCTSSTLVSQKNFVMSAAHDQIQLLWHMTPPLVLIFLTGSFPFMIQNWRALIFLESSSQASYQLKTLPPCCVPHYLSQRYSRERLISIQNIKFYALKSYIWKVYIFLLRVFGHRYLFVKLFGTFSWFMHCTSLYNPIV